MLKRIHPRFLGVLPLVFFAWTGAEYYAKGNPDELLWICNVCNLLLGFSLLGEWRAGIWASTPWLIAGTPTWLMDAVLASGFELHSFFTHIVSAWIGMLACRLYPTRAGGWWKAVIIFLIFQQIARLVTRPTFNVNSAFQSYGVSMPYPLYWLLCAAGFALALFSAEVFVRRFVLPRSETA